MEHPAKKTLKKVQRREGAVRSTMGIPPYQHDGTPVQV
jgi:hypothetical protein